MTEPVRRLGILVTLRRRPSIRLSEVRILWFGRSSKRVTAARKLAAHAHSFERFGESLASDKETDESGGHAQNDLNAQLSIQRGHGAWEDCCGNEGRSAIGAAADLQVKA